MILSSPLVLEKVWLDKPKYDAAERRYYERLTESSQSSKTEVEISSTINSNVVCSKNDLPKVAAEGNIILEQENAELATLATGELKAEGSSKSGNACVKDVFPKPAEENVSSKSNSPVIKKKQENVSPQKGEDSKKTVKEEIPSPAQNKKEPNKSNLPSKSEKHKKNNSSPPKANSNSKVESIPKQNESEEHVCLKPKCNAKQLEGKLLEALQSNTKMDTNFTEQISEVAKLKGYFLQSKTLFPQSDSSLTKGTNVNNIPEISKLNPCPEKVKPTNTIKKVNQTNQSLPPLDKQETTDLIIPTDSISETQGDEQTKKDSKRKKRNKKERLRDKKGITQNPNSWNSLAGEVAKARQHIKNSLQCIDDIAITSNTVSVEVTNRLVTLEKENQELTSRMEKMEQRISSLEKALQAATAAAAAAASRPVEKAAPPPRQPAPQQNDDDDDDGVDLFGSDSEEEDTEAAKIKEQRLAEYAARKAKKPVLIAKSNIIFDVKPWDDETDMKLLEAEVRKIQIDGLVWGASKLVPLAYGIHKLQISCVVEDDKVSVDELQETIQEIEDYVQSVDIAAFNKV